MSYHRRLERKTGLKRLCAETNRAYGDGAYFDKQKNRYIRYYSARKPSYAKFLRKISNRRLRRSGEKLNNGLYKKIYDYKWVLD